MEWPSPGIACLAITPTFWDTEMADWHENYNATPAPLVVGDLVISGTAGGDEGARGLVAAFNQSSGKEVWRFWTVPRRGEPGVETWKWAEVEHPGAVTWMAGSEGTRVCPAGRRAKLVLDIEKGIALLLNDDGHAHEGHGPVWVYSE